MPRVDNRILKAPTCRCRGALSCLLLLLTAGIVEAAGHYVRMEESFTIAGLVADPSDYAVTDVKVQILQPNATTISLPAFFDGGTTWRVRHTPTNAGVYQVTDLTSNGSPLVVGGLSPNSWTVSGNPTGPGFVRRNPANASRFITSNGRRYYPFGHDVAWDQSCLFEAHSTKAWQHTSVRVVRIDDPIILEVPRAFWQA